MAVAAACDSAAKRASAGAARMHSCSRPPRSWRSRVVCLALLSLSGDGARLVRHHFLSFRSPLPHHLTTPPLPPPWALPPPCVPNPSVTLSRQNGGVVLPANFAHAPPRARDTSGSRARATVAARMAVASLSAAGSASLTRTFRVWRAPPRAHAPTSVAAHDARPPSKSCC